MYSAPFTDSDTPVDHVPRHILLAIDDLALRASASDCLIRHGYATSTAASKKMPSEVWRKAGVDCLIVDDSAGAENTTRLCSGVRQLSASLPIIVLGSQEGTEARIDTLEAGADDYVLKPIDPRALMARVKAIFRASSRTRTSPTPWRAGSYAFGSWRLNVPSHTLRHSDGSVRILTAAEFKLLEAFLKDAGKVIPRARLLRVLHGAQGMQLEHALEARISRMRRLLGESGRPASQSLIRNVYGAGYAFEGTVVLEP
jgi:two-component system OmpR family response regulator